MKTYKETKQAFKELVLTIGLDNIRNYHLTALYDAGHNVTNVCNAHNYFKYSPQAAKYRK